jgi:hypothetical protein
MTPEKIPCELCDRKNTALLYRDWQTTTYTIAEKTAVWCRACQWKTVFINVAWRRDENGNVLIDGDWVLRDC